MFSNDENMSLNDVLKQYAELRKQVDSTDSQKQKTHITIEDRIEAENPFYSRSTLITYAFWR